MRRELTHEAYLGCHKMGRSPHVLRRILTVFIEAMMVFSHISHPSGLKAYSLKGHLTPSRRRPWNSS